MIFLVASIVGALLGLLWVWIHRHRIAERAVREWREQQDALNIAAARRVARAVVAEAAAKRAARGEAPLDSPDAEMRRAIARAWLDAGNDPRRLGFARNGDIYVADRPLLQEIAS